MRDVGGGTSEGALHSGTCSAETFLDGYKGEVKNKWTKGRRKDVRNK